MIERIGQWVLEEALRDAARWEQMRPDLPPLRVGVNVSVHQLQNPRFPDSVADAIEAVRDRASDARTRARRERAAR